MGVCFIDREGHFDRFLGPPLSMTSPAFLALTLPRFSQANTSRLSLGR